MNDWLKKMRAILCKYRGHVWTRKRSAEIKHCSRCGVQRAVKRRIAK